MRDLLCKYFFNIPDQITDQINGMGSKCIEDTASGKFFRGLPADRTFRVKKFRTIISEIKMNDLTDITVFYKLLCSHDRRYKSVFKCYSAGLSVSGFFYQSFDLLCTFQICCQRFFAVNIFSFFYCFLKNLFMQIVRSTDIDNIYLFIFQHLIDGLKISFKFYRKFFRLF